MNEPSLPQIIPIPNSRIKDRTGQRYGRLLVLGYVGQNSHKKALWLCACDCGNHVVVTGNGLESKKSSSCGCLRSDVVRKRSVVHNQSRRTPEYEAWAGMRSRCKNPKTRQFKDYGGRGIRVCQRWDSFVNFFDDMGAKPSHQHSLDRIDVDGNYSCGQCSECINNGWQANCRWATRSKQNNNVRSNVLLEFQGETKTRSEWASVMGIDYYLLRQRIDRLGWSVERALTTPVNKKVSQA